MEPVGDLDSRQQALKPIQTKRSAAREVEGDGKKPEDIKEEEGEALSPVGRIFHETCFNVCHSHCWVQNQNQCGCC